MLIDQTAKLYGKRLQFALNEAQWQQKDLVQETGLSKSGISNYVKGVTLPSRETQMIIAHALNIDVEWFFEDTKIKPTTDGLIHNFEVAKAAKVLGVSPKKLHQTLQEGRVPWGYATPNYSTDTTKWTYHISFRALADYMHYTEEEMLATGKEQTS